MRYVASGVAGLALVAGLHLGGMINPAANTDSGVLASAVPQETAVLAALEPAAGLESETILSASRLGLDTLAGLLNPHRDENGQIRRARTAVETAHLREIEEESASAVPQPKDLHVKVGKGDTLAGLLMKAGLDTGETHTVVSEVSRHFNLRNLRAGQVMDLRLDPKEGGENFQLASASLAIDPLKTLYVERNESGDIASRLDEKPVIQSREARRVMIDGSVYGSADRAGLPDSVTANTIRLFSYAIDFQRDIKEGDQMEVMYDSYTTDDGYVAKTGDISYARMVLSGREYALYRFETKDGEVDYYTPEGKSLRKATGLMKTPVAYGRMSSGYGMRRHPVLGYTKMHKGIDFAAPIGTPIYAAADGTVERAGRFSSYGNYVRIKHSSKLSTAYAHVSRFATGVRPGARVKQGQVIAYVGNTGRSTGPHLHYEIMMNGVQVNPRNVKFAVDSSLKGEDLRRFKKMVSSMGQEYAEKIKDSVKVASLAKTEPAAE